MELFLSQWASCGNSAKVAPQSLNYKLILPFAKENSHDAANLEKLRLVFPIPVPELLVTVNIVFGNKTLTRDKWNTCYAGAGTLLHTRNRQMVSMRTVVLWQEGNYTCYILLIFISIYNATVFNSSASNVFRSIQSTPRRFDYSIIW